MKCFTKYSLGMLACIFSTASLTASSGSDALSFIRIVRDPARGAMGGAGYAYSGSIAWSSWSNAAAVPFSADTFNAATGYQMWQPSFSGTNAVSAGAGWNLKGRIGIAAGLTYGACPSYDIYGENGVASGKFTPSEIQANIGVGWRFLKFLSAGVNLHYAGTTLAEKTSYGAFAADIFLMGRVSDFSLTAGVSSLGSKVKDASGTAFSLPASVSVGAGYSHVFGQRHEVDVLADLDWYFSGGMSAAIGAGYTFNDLLSIRAGYHYGSQARFSTSGEGFSVIDRPGSPVPSYASVGAGISFFGIHIDFAYLIGTGMDSPMKNTFSVGVGYRF